MPSGTNDRQATPFVTVNKWNMRDTDLVTPLIETNSRSLYERGIHHWHRNCGVKSQISQVKEVLDTHEMIGSAASLCCGFYCVCQSVFTWGGVRRDWELTGHHLSAGFISVMTVLVPYINNIWCPLFRSLDFDCSISLSVLLW